MSDFIVRDANEHYSGELALAKRLAAADGLAKALRLLLRPCAELAHESADFKGYISRGPVANHATGNCDVDYYAMASESIAQADAALAAWNEVKP